MSSFISRSRFRYRTLHRPTWIILCSAHRIPFRIPSPRRISRSNWGIKSKIFYPKIPFRIFFPLLRPQAPPQDDFTHVIPSGITSPVPMGTNFKIPSGGFFPIPPRDLSKIPEDTYAATFYKYASSAPTD